MKMNKNDEKYCNRLDSRLFFLALKVESNRVAIWSFAMSFYRAMLCIRGTSHGSMSLSVCLSVTSRSSTKTAKRRIT